MKEDKSYASEYVNLQWSVYREDPEVAISLLNDFYDQYSEQDLNGELKIMINASKGNILYVNGHLERALPIYKELMHEMPRSSIIYTSMLERVSTILISFNKREEAISPVVDYLNKEQISWNNTLIMLKVLCVNNESIELEKFRSHIDWVAQDLGLAVPHQTVMEDVEYLVRENSAANRRHMSLSISYNALSSEDRVEMLEKYIADEQVGFYRNLAIKKLNDQKDR